MTVNREKILYIYDFDHWALHNVGLFWAELLKNKYSFDFIKVSDRDNYSASSYAYVIDSCTFIQQRNLFRRRVLSRLGIKNLLNWDPKNKKNIVSIVHDPCEIFPQVEDWKKEKPYLRRIKNYSKIAVISNEMQAILSQYGFNCKKINTNSMLSIREADELVIEPLKIFTKANNSIRKNLDLFSLVKRSSHSLCEKFDGYFGRTVFPVAEYENLITQYNCYICTSWQEGGPIPLMDAMAKGCAILTTPVGQTDELVIDGENGFFCKNESEFTQRISQLSSDEALLYRMRIRSIEIISGINADMIRNQLIEFLC